MAWPLLEPSRPPALPPVLGSSSDTKSLGPLLVGIIAHVQIRIVITAATETPRGEHRTPFSRMLPRVMGTLERYGWLARS